MHSIADLHPPPHTHTRMKGKNTHSTAQNSKVKNTVCEECGKQENLCTPVKLESKIKRKKEAVERRYVGKSPANSRI